MPEPKDTLVRTYGFLMDSSFYWRSSQTPFTKSYRPSVVDYFHMHFWTLTFSTHRRCLTSFRAMVIIIVGCQKAMIPGCIQ